jgi:hypothetical protein
MPSLSQGHLLIYSSKPEEFRNRLLRAAIAEGEASGVAEDGVFERIREKYGIAQREVSA